MKDFTLEKIGGKIPPNAQLDFNVFGDKVFALNVPAGCKIAFDNKAFVVLRTGLRYGVNGWFSQTLREILMKINSNLANALTPNTFNKISIRNENTEDSVDVELLAGFGDINDDSTIITNTVKTSENWEVVQSGSMEDFGEVKYWLSGYNYAVVENIGAGDICFGPLTAQGITISAGEKFGFSFKGNFTFSAKDTNSVAIRYLVFKQGA